MLKKTQKHYLKIQHQHPGFIEAVEELGTTLKLSGPLDEKTVQLLQLAAATALRSEGAVHSHVTRSLQAGASKEEVHHALIVLTSTIGFPSVMAGLSWADDIIEKKDG